ncbi:MAG: efflux transporter periplasmic adaptor subunit [Rhizobacter sp.]|nr:efflux transporter periplasmic adaptor subunit [Rhizobacter sp.]
MRRLVLCLGVAVVLGACSKTETVPEPIRAVRTVTIASDSAGAAFDYSGEIMARTESRLSFRIGGKLVRRLVNLGDSVKAGQLLAQLDPQDLRLAQESARAGLSSAQVAFDQAAIDYKRYKDLRDQGFISSAELERRDATLKSSRALLDQAKAQSSVQGNQEAYARLVSDVPGVVTGIDAEPGMVVASGTPVLRLAHDGPRDVVFAVPEDRVTAVREASAVAGALTVRLWGAEEQALPATIREVAAAADSASRTFLVKASIGEATVRLGQTATVHLVMPRIAGIIKVPLSAVADVAGKTSVWVVDEPSMTVKPQAVQIGGAEGNSVIVVGGISPGQRVVTAGVHVLTPGQKVKLYVEPGTAPVATKDMISTPEAGSMPASATASGASR